VNYKEIIVVEKSGKKNYLVIVGLHILMMVYSLSSVLSKKASGEKFLSLRFCLFYGGVLFLLALYALFWQQIIKRLPLSFAFANKAVTVIWGMVWGILIFGESISVQRIIGAVIVIIGIVLFSMEDHKHE